MYSNIVSSTFGQLSTPVTSTCIFSKLPSTGFNNIGHDKPKPCSTEKIRPSAILCAEHLKTYFNLAIKAEIAKPSDSPTYLKYFSLKFAATPDILLPFPMKLRPKRCLPETSTDLNDITNYEFCLDQPAIQSGFSIATTYLPPQVLGTLLSNSNLSDVYVTNMSSPVSINPGVGQAYTPLLMANSLTLEKYWENVKLLAISTSDTTLNGIKESPEDGTIKIPMSMLPGIYKFLFYYAAISNIKSTKSDVINEYHVMPPNVILNLDTQSFEIINKSTQNKIFTYGGPDGPETITTSIILCAEKLVPDLKREVSTYHVTSLMTNVPVCSL